MNKRKYFIILFIIGISITIYAFYFYLTENRQKFNIPQTEGEIIKQIPEDLNDDGSTEEITITKYSPQPFVYLSNLYIKNGINNPYVRLKGLYRNIRVMDLNNDNHRELIFYLLSGKLLTLQIFSYTNDELIELKFKEQDKEVNIWVNGEVTVEDSSSDGVLEIIFTDIIQGARLSERITIKKFFRWSGEYYEKYNEEKTTEDSGFGG